jgi:dihydrofolate reductase
MSANPNLHIIVAMTNERLIGVGGTLPWELPDDLQLFKHMTMGHTVIMGRKTFASIGAPLPGRKNIIISSSHLANADIEIFDSFAEALAKAESLNQKIFCIGGKEIYAEALPLATHLHISWIQGDFSGDTYFPDFDISKWQEQQQQVFNGFTHITYLRKQ